MFSSIMVESSPSSISLVRFSSMREIMDRFRQWFFFKPLRPTLRKAAIKLKTKSTKDKRIPKYKGKINLLKSEPQKPGKKINPKPQKYKKIFNPRLYLKHKHNLSPRWWPQDLASPTSPWTE